jgi:hypothetical protein
MIRRTLNWIDVSMLEGEVEVDESLFARHKYHVGRVRKTMKRWVFGLRQRNSNRARFFIVNNDRSHHTLIPLILQCVRPGSTIYSDGWAAYNSLT